MNLLRLTYRITCSFLICIILLPIHADGQEKEKPGQKTFALTEPLKLDFGRMDLIRKRLAENDPSLQKPLLRLLEKADALLSFPPVSVMQKSGIPPSGDRHDYMSLAPYWWPDPNKPDGIPYIRRDGEVNPESRTYTDKENMPSLCQAVYYLGLAHYYTGKADYARHAAKLLKAWFLDTATRMNPNLKFGQAVKGITEGRAEGIIETRHFIYALDAVHLIKSSPYWSQTDHQSLQDWFRQYLDWLETHPVGIDEKNAKNNHGIWYDAQRLSFALFIGDKSRADAVVMETMKRLDDQTDGEGRFPLELERTKSLHYSAYCLQAFMLVASLSSEASTDLWKVKTLTGKTIQKPLDFLIPYLMGTKTWQWQQIDIFKPSAAYGVLWPAYHNMQCSDCFEILRKDTNNTFTESILVLL